MQKSLVVNVRYLRTSLRNIELPDFYPRRTVSLSDERCCCFLRYLCRYVGVLTLVLLKWRRDRLCVGWTEQTAFGERKDLGVINMSYKILT